MEILTALEILATSMAMAMAMVSFQSLVVSHCYSRIMALFEDV